ncbi:hypothetical protein POX_e06763 [Penicillium oxalicum]|uniref:hypothetical protein n=1 Tax=Penicillium oxalicum TaxID=69781 RepID=UPI0020B64C0C|nr:hypothetical protein POX_e06763 [Penicillium oxalicum]KAI2788742.1 hypothetical protein POX_e06763 [Penicillium oxalicum]
MEEEAVDTAKALRGPLRAHQQPNYDQPSNKSLAERLTFLKGTWTELRLQSPASSLLRNMDFPSPHVVAPQERHTHTAIFLHGRGSTALEFCEDLLQSTTSQLKSLPDSLPHFRWVFPAAKTLYSTRFQEMQWAWFDVWSLENVEERQELVLEGLRESVSHLLAILADEIERVGGDASRVFLCGISQGMATALWTFFCAVGQIKQPLGGLVGFCGWLPFARKVEDLIRRQQAMALLPSSVTGLILADSNGLDNNRAILTFAS